MKRFLLTTVAAMAVAHGSQAQTPPPAQNPPPPAGQAPPPTPRPSTGPITSGNQADALSPQKGEQEPRPVEQEAANQALAGQPPVAPAAAATPGDDEEDEDDKPKWDVQNPPGPSHEATIDVTEGTWMSVDVSPDGQEIVFDLLGDIYVMPIGGGTARPIAQGVAWDMQAKYSPDDTKSRGCGCCRSP